MSKLVNDLYKTARAVGKVASAVNYAEKLWKSISTGDPSHIAKRIARKETHKQANKIASSINKLLK